MDAEVDSGHKVAVQVGDFNGDGKKDLAVLFLPRTKPSAGDLIVLPTEAGIDTYVYWNGSEYALFEPEEMP